MKQPIPLSQDLSKQSVNGAQPQRFPSCSNSSQKTTLVVRGKAYTRAELFAAFNPSMQVAFGANEEECFTRDFPTLANIREAYGKNAPAAWLVPQLFNLSEYCGCRIKLEEEERLRECAEIIANTYFYLTQAELLLFFHRFKAGRYGRFYGSIDPLLILTALKDFIAERAQTIDAYEARKRREREEERRKHYVTYEEYQRMKQNNLHYETSTAN